MSRTNRFRRAYIGGTFDCLHRGHLKLFKAAREVAGELVVALNTDEFTARYKRHPLMPFYDRWAVLDACKLVDQVVINSGDEDSKPSILLSGADCIVHGDDWRGESLMNQMGIDREWLQDHQISLVILPYTQAMSTTKILEMYADRGKAMADPNTTVCATCRRLIMVEHADADGNCSECPRPNDKPTEAEWVDIGRPEGE